MIQHGWPATRLHGFPRTLELTLRICASRLLVALDRSPEAFSLASFRTKTPPTRRHQVKSRTAGK